MPDQCQWETPSSRSWLRWRRSWGGAGRGAEHRGWDTDGLSATRCRLLSSDEPSDDSEPPGSCRKTRIRINNCLNEFQQEFIKTTWIPAYIPQDVPGWLKSEIIHIHLMIFFLKHLLNCGLVSEYFRNTQVALVTSCICFKGHKPKTKYDNDEWKCKHLLKTSINALFQHSIPIKLYHSQLCLQLFVVPESSLHLSVHKHLHECSREVYHETKLMVSKHKISVSVP